MIDAKFSELKGKTLKAITGKVGDGTMTFESVDGACYQLTHYQDCCERCSIEDICGELSDLLGEQILLAEEVSNKEPEASIVLARQKEKQEYEAQHGPDSFFDTHDSETWTFYKLATVKGAVTIRWYGKSNGYYSESVTFERLA